MPVAGPTRLLLVHHSRTGSTARLVEAALQGIDSARAESGLELDVRVLDAFEAGPDDVLRCTGVLLATPERLGYLSGAMKDFFDRIYEPCLDRSRGRPFVLLVRGATDGAGAVLAAQRIATGLGWKEVLPAVVARGPEVTPDHLSAASELGATFAAGLVLGVW